METSLLLVLMGFAVWTLVCAFIMEKTGNQNMLGLVFGGMTSFGLGLGVLLGIQ